MKKTLINLIVNSFYLFFDILFFNVATVISYAIPYYVNEGKIVSYQEMYALQDMTRFMIFIPFLVFVGSGIYRIAWSRAKVEDFSLIFRSVALCDVLLLVAIYIFRAEEAGAKTIASWPFSSFVYIIFTATLFLCGWRVFFRFCLEKEFFSRAHRHRIILIGLHEISDEVLNRILTNRNPSYQVVAFFDRKGNRLAGIPGFSSIDQFPEVLDQENCDSVIISTAAINQNELFSIIQLCEQKKIDYQILPTYMDLMATKSRVDLVNFVPMLSYSQPSISGWNLFFKMFFDFLVALTILAMFSWLWILIMILIIFDSPGNPIFTQMRIGRYGRTFRIFKFRTMISGAEKLGPLTQNDDVRITRFGRFLRRWSLDEIPQLINVLLGQMSLIGPRAVVPLVAKQFDEWEKISLNVLPGITGLAQVYGRNRLSLIDKSFLSVYYIRNYSVFLDIKILFRTILTIIRGTGSGGTIEASKILYSEIEKDLFDGSDKKTKSPDLFLE